MFGYSGHSLPHSQINLSVSAALPKYIINNTYEHDIKRISLSASAKVPQLGLHKIFRMVSLGVTSSLSSIYPH
jgi:hypothetical protein